MNGAINFGRLEKEVPLKDELGTLGGIVSAFIPAVFVLAGFGLLLYLLWGGFSLMLSRGDAKAVEAAKTKITNAVIGFVVIIIAFWLVQLLGAIFGIEQFQQVFGR